MIAREKSVVRAAERTLGLGPLIAHAHLSGRAIQALPEAERYARSAQNLGFVAQAACRNQGLSVRLHGEPPGGPALIVANHRSYLDPIAIAAAIPCLPIAKAEAAGWPLIGPALSRLGVLFVRRGDELSGALAMRQVARALRHRACVLGFPEGTSHAGPEVLPFAGGLFGLARRIGVPVVPVAVHYPRPEAAWVGAASFLPHFWGISALDEVQVELAFGEPLSPRIGAEALRDAAHASIVERLVMIARDPESSGRTHGGDTAATRARATAA